MEDKKKSKQIPVRFDDNILKKVEKQAELEHRNNSEFIRHCVLVYLEKVEEVRRITL